MVHVGICSDWGSGFSFPPLCRLKPPQRRIIATHGGWVKDYLTRCQVPAIGGLNIRGGD